LTITEKVQLVEQAHAEFGLGSALATVGLASSTWYHRRRQISYEQKHSRLRAPLLGIAEQYPEYGYRRATDELSERLGAPINRKVVQKLNRIWGLTMLRGCRPPKPSGVRQVITAAGGRANLVAGLEEIGPFEVLYTDFTELIYRGGRAWLMAIIDHLTKYWLGWSLGETATTEVALEAWRAAVGTLSDLGWPINGVIVHHDRDPVYTSYSWTRQLLLQDEARISYALRGAKDNPEMESFNSRFKNENRSLIADDADMKQLRCLITERQGHYNRRRRHSALGNQAPWTFVQSLKTDR
jgi:transposase InsO family protein